MKKFEKGRSVDPNYYHIPLKYFTNVMKGKYKELCIVDFMADGSALVAWHNYNTGRTGIVRRCPVNEKHGKFYLDYRGKDIEIDTWGWVF